jgi:adenylate kinase family enzyme
VNKFSSLSKNEITIYQKSVDFIKKHKKELINKFCDSNFFYSVEQPLSIFMAGSPGCGKTEFSQNLILKLKNEKIVRIDADDIRKFIPYYNGHNSYLAQGGASLGVKKLLDFCLHHKLNFILDGTFANYQKVYSNITRCLKRKRTAKIYYVYQNPLIAWKFVQKREKIEHRFVPLNVFIKTSINSKKNVVKIKKDFKKLIKLNFVVQNEQNITMSIYYDVDNIDKYMDSIYTRVN